MRTSSLKSKKVLRKSDGSFVGKICDFEFCPSSYQIQALCLKEKSGRLRSLWSLFFHERLVVVGVDRILLIGKDVIVCDLPAVEKK